MDGLWLDMNEISNFCDGECDNTTNTSGGNSSVSTNDPPYSINNQGDRRPLNSKTIDMDATHYNGLEYDVHNLYGKIIML